jgi:(2Fe-2S) ferredoxin
MGPALQDEFTKILPRAGIEVKINEDMEDAGALERLNSPSLTARVGLISHIGGHKFAGNVIIYIPPGARSATGEPHILAGCGIWYGRMEPRHVEGIVSQTILGGVVLKDMFRGGVKQGGEILRL